MKTMAKKISMKEMMKVNGGNWWTWAIPSNQEAKAQLSGLHIH